MIIDGLNFKFYVGRYGIKYGAVRRMVRERSGNRPPIVKYQFLYHSPYNYFFDRAADKKYFHDELTAEQKKDYVEGMKELDIADLVFRCNKIPGLYTDEEIQRGVQSIESEDIDSFFERWTNDIRKWALSDYKSWREKEIAEGNSGKIPGDVPENE